MFADPAVVTINAVAKNLVRINQDKYSSEYLLRTSTEEHRLFIRNTSYVDKRRGVTIDRHNVEIVNTVFPVAPATTSIVRKTYTVIENQQGDTLVDPRNVALGLFAFLSSAKIDQLMNLES
ncbi:coat protein [ssRNA phage Gerhypos.4_12]|jgi:hypothetical protein|uniref:Coat protein n=2 Tax=Leviviricetes TaxID=2842243 RepID=A0A8S5L2U3_9VIRU|nr:coat protein [ssRNA phage Gerhypos.4_12]QDH91473.1 MAG: hypothetical protein H4Bulk46369_000002 [Leviviridae sp.]DAD51811.1 TPA_asm: coat protein [ssRNA phage Gerhypos.4_12]